MQRRVKIFLAAGIAVAAVATWVIGGREYERRQRRDEEYKAAPDRYAAIRDGYESAATSDFGFTTCYGSRWDRYSRKVFDDVISHKGDKAYNAKMADHYRGLAKKYQDAIRRGQPPEKLDPPLGPQRTGDSP